MAKNNNLTDFLTDIANTIRTKKGTTEIIPSQNFSSEISELGVKTTLAKFIDNTILEINEIDFDNATSIGNYTFYRLSHIDKIKIPSTVTTIGDYAFASCTSLKTITIPASVTTIRNHAFSECTSLISINIPSSVTTLEWNAFYYCTTLSSVELSSNITIIDYQAFYACTRLGSITIPASVTEIKTYAFSDCYRLSTMRLRPINPPILGGTNSISSNTTRIEVPNASLNAYQTATNWSNFSSIMVGV